ncbi:hypothetical protein [uncultured Mucilaginibacter sp.]|uniref:hypothetical protein n=1 Tax=uncultured Mucilaginibacter sp. TaxID=797541 RepID=UPI0026315566|nr:hypothetical protein [uncultured Mucilaginibacter sp.]
MIQTIVTPDKPNFDMTVSLPVDYVGKQVHVLFYINEEVKKTTVSILPQKKPSNFFGTLSLEEGEKMQAYINQSRNEWERNF